MGYILLKGLKLMLSTEKTAAHGGGAVAKIQRKRLIELGFVTRCVQFYEWNYGKRTD